MANPFYVQPGNAFGQGLQALAQTVGQTGEVMRQREQQQKQEAYQAEARQALAEAVQSGDPMKIAEVSSRYPEIAQAAQQTFGFVSDQSKEIVRNAYTRVLTDPANAEAYLDQAAQDVLAVGGQPINIVNDIGMFRANPQAALQRVRAGYATIDPEGYKSLFGAKPDEMKVGRFRQITLPDGSIATLDTATNAVTPIAEAPPVDLSILPPDMQDAVSKQSVETQRKIVESFATPAGAAKSTEVEKQKQKAEEVKGRTSQLVNELLENENGIRAISGFFDELTPNILGNSRNAQAALDELKNMLTVDNLGLMSGVLSETDIKILRDVGASGLAGDQERIISTLKKMKDALEGKQTTEEVNWGDL